MLSQLIILKTRYRISRTYWFHNWLIEVFSFCARSRFFSCELDVKLSHGSQAELVPFIGRRVSTDLRRHPARLQSSAWWKGAIYVSSKNITALNVLPQILLLRCADFHTLFSVCTPSDLICLHIGSPPFLVHFPLLKLDRLSNIITPLGISPIIVRKHGG